MEVAVVGWYQMRMVAEGCYRLLDSRLEEAEE
jgi:hypothetical protein